MKGTHYYSVILFSLCMNESSVLKKRKDSNHIFPQTFSRSVVVMMFSRS